MKSVLRILGVFGILLFPLISSLAEALEPPTVGNYTLVSTRRVTRTHSDFTYRAQLTNLLPDGLTGVQATLTSRSPATQVIDGSLGFGDVAPGATVVSQDTFTIRQDRTLPFNPADLVWSVGVQLGGASNTLAHDAIVTVPPVGVDPSEIENGVILTRLDVFLAVDATVGEVNAALASIGAKIVSMFAGADVVTVAIPRQTGIEGLTALAQTLMSFPGIRLAIHGPQTRVTEFAASNDVSAARHLVPARFPAAWNATGLISNCQAVPLLIPDQFLNKPAGFDLLFPGFPNPASPGATGDPRQDEHGYHVTAVAAAPLSLSKSPGTNPFINCIDLKPIETAGMMLPQQLGRLALFFPSAGKFVVNYSHGFLSNCRGLFGTEEKAFDCPDAPMAPTGLSPKDQVAKDIVPPLYRARMALEWKKMTRSRWPDFLVAASAGNERNDGLAGVAIYPGLGVAANANAIAVAAKADPLFAFALDASQWTPAQSFLNDPPGFVSLVPDLSDMDALRADVRAAGLESVVADNVIVVGGLTTVPGDPRLLSPGHELLSEADFSNSDPDVKTVGVAVAGACASLPCPSGSGNSRAAPQVAGLAAYLLALSADLRNQPASVTRRAIVDNARDDGQTPDILDAYAAVLSLDAAALPNAVNAPVRKAILNVNTGGASANRFDEADIAEFLSNFFQKDANGNFILDANGNPVEPSAADFSRYDLNGDGFTGGSFTEHLDLDRVGSTQFGATNYSTITQAVEGNLLEFNENGLTDLDILCYYAYSGLYEGDPEVRRQLLSQLPGSKQCVFSVKPRTVALASSQQQQFEAIGAPGEGAVTWTASGGAIDSNTGLFTAGSSSGTFTVRATSVTDPIVFAEATVTVTVADQSPLCPTIHACLYAEFVSSTPLPGGGTRFFLRFPVSLGLDESFRGSVGFGSGSLFCTLFITGNPSGGSFTGNGSCGFEQQPATITGSFSSSKLEFTATIQDRTGFIQEVAYMGTRVPQCEVNLDDVQCI